jgi:hypothetical protein
MKMHRFVLNTFAGLAGASLWFAAVSPRHADAAETNAAASPATNGISIKITAGHENSPADNYFGLPKEAFDRLTPEQITELAQLHKDQNGNALDSISMALFPVVLFTFIGVCVWLGVSGRQKRNRMVHDTLRLMIEKGQPIPPELLQSQDPPRRPKSDLRSGLVLVGIGIGVGLFLVAQHGNAWTAALIPLLMGVAFLITWKIESNKNGQSK